MLHIFYSQAYILWNFPGLGPWLRTVSDAYIADYGCKRSTWTLALVSIDRWRRGVHYHFPQWLLQSFEADIAAQVTDAFIQGDQPLSICIILLNRGQTQPFVTHHFAHAIMYKWLHWLWQLYAWILDFQNGTLDPCKLLHTKRRNWH